jgi:putative tricarboxylic transport membrane protein
MERALRQSLMMSQGDLGILVSRPISAVILCLAAAILVAPLFKAGGRRLRAVP